MIRHLYRQSKEYMSSKQVNIIQLFEHEKLKINDIRHGICFRESYWQALLKLNEKQFPPFFRIIHRGIQCTSFVGVIATPEFTLEILPKADAHTSNPGIWRNLLLDMLDNCEEIPHHTAPAASLKVREGHLLDIWLSRFLALTETLLQQGLAKAYRTEEGSTSSLRGKLLFSRNIRHNIIHQEKFYTRYQSYNQAHLFHQVLEAALTYSAQLTSAPHLQLKARQLKQHFPSSRFKEFSPHMLQRISYNRQTLRYRPAVELALLLLSHLSPILKAGDQPVFTLLFDMNRLFEEYIYRQLKKATQKKNLLLHKQTSAHFWANRSLRPDILLQTPQGENIILDTKWKILQHNQPADDDLKQIYIYNHYFHAQRGVLLYPQASSQASRKEAYHQPARDKLYCEVQFVNVIDKATQRLNPLAGEEILANLKLHDYQITF